MRLRFIYFFACAISLASCKVNVTENIAKQMVKVNVDSMNFIDEFIDDKDIVILGEASHGDGHTFEIKSDLVKYLVEQKRFNALAFESRDFLEIEYIRGNSSYFVVKDQNRKRYGEFCLSVFTLPIPIDGKLYGYLVRRLSEQMSKSLN